MAEQHAHGQHGQHGHGAAPAGGSWVSTFVFSIVLFLAVYLTVLYTGHTLAGGH